MVLDWQTRRIRADAEIGISLGLVWGMPMNIKPIRTESDYEAALREIERLWEAEPGSSDGDKLDVLTTLVEAYEEKQYRKRPLTLTMIRQLQSGLGVSAEILVQPYELQTAA